MEVLQPYLDKTDLKLCWDIEKTYASDGTVNQKVLAFLIKNKLKVDQVHLHSLINGRSHRVIQTGVIDFSYYLGLFTNARVRDYCIEVRPKEKAVESLRNLESILTQV